MHDHGPRSRGLNRWMWCVGAAGAAAVGVGFLSTNRAVGQGPKSIPNLQGFPNSAGVVRTFTTQGSIDLTNPFFQPLGSNGKTCEHCHFPEDGFGLSQVTAQKLFNETAGLHPLFLPDASDNPVAAAALPANASIDDRKAVYSLILNKADALVKIALLLPSQGAEFRLAGVNDPHTPLSLVSLPDGSTVGDPSSYLSLTQGNLWLHRRPLPTTNLNFVTAAAWDGRNAPNANPFVATTRDGLVKTAKDAIIPRLAPDGKAPDGHTYSDAELSALAEQMTDLEFTLYTAQSEAKSVGSLDAQGALGGPVNLAQQPFHFGINDVLQGDINVTPPGIITSTGNPFTPVIFTTYNSWNGTKDPHRAAVVRGQALFNSQRLTISGVGGLNNTVLTLPDGSTIPGPGTFRGSCGTCHDSPNIGNHSTRLPINIGVADEAPAALGSAAVADLPLFTLHRLNPDGSDADWTNPANTVRTTDPGRATRTGKWAHVGEFKGPILRGLESRSPYFHNGMAGSLEDVVDFYNTRFQGGFNAQEKSDLVEFLKTL